VFRFLCGDRRSDSAEGSHSFYYYIENNLGLKVFKSNNLRRAQTEYLLDMYAQSSKETIGLTCEVLACGYVMSIRNRVRPGIWMRHVDGITAYQYAIDLGYEHNNRFNKVEAFSWGYESLLYRPLINRMNYICDALQSIGFSCIDHLENSGNFMVDRYKHMIAIDFSMEEKYMKKDIIKNVYEKYGEKLSITIPNDYIDRHSSIGF
jgi:hypothetical protein